MKHLRRACQTLLVYLIASTLCSLAATACDRLPAGETIWIRLTSPVSTFNAKVGDQVQAVVTQDVTCESETVFPVGAHVYGTVESVRKVGLGVRHETAALKIGFTEIAASSDTLVDVTAEIAEIDNARESVSKGAIHGIRSTNTLQGTITSRLKYLPTLNPYPDLGLLLFKATFPIFPEPEIYLPAGADIQLRLAQPVINPPASIVETESPSEPSLDTVELRTLISELPERSATDPDMVPADVINLALLGSREQLESAFTHAGWQTADATNRHSVMLIVHAFLDNSAYDRAPMRPFLVEGKVPDLNWEKSLNTYAQRDHMRVWQWTGSSSESPVWLGTATHDRSGGISLKRRQFVHHIDPDIDDERSKVIRDLRAAGCVKSVYLAPREELAAVKENATGDVLRTDGAIAVVQLQECQSAVPELASDPQTRPYNAGNVVFRYFRREVMTVRNDMWRANIIYGTYDVLRMGFHAWKKHESVVVASSTAKHRDPQHAKKPQSVALSAADLSVQNQASTLNYK